MYYLQVSQNARVTTLSELGVYCSYVFNTVHVLGQYIEYIHIKMHGIGYFKMLII
jgi:hypothetical protein